MLKSNLCYPFPVLRNESIDYKTSIFDVQINKEIEDTYHVIKAKYNITNDYINGLIENGYAKVGLIIKSSAVWYRKFFDITHNDTIKIDSKEVYGRVYILPCIVATRTIENFHSSDFEEEFKMTNIKVNAGEIIGLSEELVFDALLNSDVFQNSSSIFDIISTKDDHISYDLTQSKIVIMIPKSIHDYYKGLERHQLKPAPVLNSMIIFPVLVEVLEEMKRSFDEFEEMNNNWYKTIKKTIENKKEKHLINGLDINGEIDNPYLVAQSLTNGLLVEACDKLKSIIEESGGGE